MYGADNDQSFSYICRNSVNSCEEKYIHITALCFCHNRVFFADRVVCRVPVKTGG